VRLATGRVKVASDLTWDEEALTFAVLHMGDQNLSCGVRKYVGPESFAEMRGDLAAALEKGDVTDLIRLIDRHFRPHTYGLWHLFKDEQRKVLDEILRLTYEGIEASYRRIHESSYPLMNYLTSMGIPLPRPFLVAAEYLANRDIRSVVEETPFDREKLGKVIDDVRRWSLVIDTQTAGYRASGRITALMEQFRANPRDLAPAETAVSMIDLLQGAGVALDLWKAQNIFFSIAGKALPTFSGSAERGDAEAARWVETFQGFGSHFGVRTD